MSVQLGTGFYHTMNSNTNRTLRLSIVASTAVNNVFESLKGTATTAPFTDAIVNPVVNDFIAAKRFDAVVRAVSVYAPSVKIVLTTTTHTNDTIIIEFETAVSQVLVGTADISDTHGVGDRAVKTKPGIQTLLNSVLANASLDKGTTLLFAANPNNSDGTASTAAVVTALTASLVV